MGSGGWSADFVTGNVMVVAGVRHRDRRGAALGERPVVTACDQAPDMLPIAPVAPFLRRDRMPPPIRRQLRDYRFMSPTLGR